MGAELAGQRPGGFGLRPLCLGGKQAGWENCTVEKVGWMGAAWVFC